MFIHVGTAQRRPVSTKASSVGSTAPAKVNVVRWTTSDICLPSALPLHSGRVISSATLAEFHSGQTSLRPRLHNAAFGRAPDMRNGA
jgi:hypothetical protein